MSTPSEFVQYLHSTANEIQQERIEAEEICRKKRQEQEQMDAKQLIYPVECAADAAAKKGFMACKVFDLKKGEYCDSLPQKKYYWLKEYLEDKGYQVEVEVNHERSYLPWLTKYVPIPFLFYTVGEFWVSWKLPADPLPIIEPPTHTS